MTVCDHGSVARVAKRVLRALAALESQPLPVPHPRPVLPTGIRVLPHLLAGGAALLGLVGSTPALGAEAQFEGWYRARGRLFDTLSLDRGLGDRNEQQAAYLEHRLWLRPRFLVSDAVALNVDFLGLNNVVWGNRPGVVTSYIDNPPQTFGQTLVPPPATSDDQLNPGFALWRAWGDFETPIGRFTIGRMPLHWGTGMMFNDGVHTAPHFADYGDTADRVQWEMLIRDQFVVQAAAEINSEGFVSDPDETVDDRAAYSLVTAYRSEDITGGLLLRLDRSPSQSFTLFTANGSVDAQLGKLHGAAEVAGQFGSGDLDNGLNEASVMGIGAVLEADLDLDVWSIELQGGLATGDGDDTDQRVRTFTFDRDYSVGLMMFEQPMPVLAAVAPSELNLGRSYEATLSDPGISNALFVKPRLRRKLIEGLHADVSWLGARTAKMPERFALRRSYGMEIGLGLQYTGVEHVDVRLDGAAFMPGTFYSEYTDDTFTGFGDTAFGVQLSTRIHF